MIILSTSRHIYFENIPHNSHQNVPVTLRVSKLIYLHKLRGGDWNFYLQEKEIPKRNEINKYLLNIMAAKWFRDLMFWLRHQRLIAFDFC